MKIAKATAPQEGAQIIRRYGAGHIVINDRTVTSSIIITPTTLDTGWPPETFAQLAAEHCAMLLDREPDVMLLGTGKRQRFPAPDIMARMLAVGIGLEVMDTPAACRTFNVLMNEGRRVVAGLLMIERD